MTERSVQDWFQIIQSSGNDGVLAEQLLVDLLGYNHRSGWKRVDIHMVLNLITAIRLDQMAKENS